MRIGVDASALTAKPTGVGNYIRPILTALVTAHPQVTWYLYGNEPIEFASFPNVVVRVSRPKLRGPVWQNTQLAGMIGADKLHAYWAANGLVPLTVPRRLGVVVTVHDLVYHFAGDTLPRISYLGRRLSQPLAIRRADALVAVSAATAADVAAVNSRTADEVIHPVVSPAFGPVPLATVERVRASLGLGEYLLATGTMEPRKNFGALIRAYVRCRDRGVDLPLLAIAGRKGWKDDELETLATQAQQRHLVRRLGYVSDQDLPGLYAGARAFILPSLYEGFGMPLLEAQLCGTPVIHGPHASMVEAAGGVGTVVGTTEDELAHALCDLAAGRLPLVVRDMSGVQNSAAQAAGRMWELLHRVARTPHPGTADPGTGTADTPHPGAADPGTGTSDTTHTNPAHSSAAQISPPVPPDDPHVPAPPDCATYTRVERPGRSLPRLLVVAPRLPYPVQGGDRLRIYHVARELAAHYDLTLVAMVDSVADLQREIPDDGVFQVVERFLKPRRSSYLQVLAALPSWVPLQRAYYRHRPIAKRVREIAPQFHGALAHLIRTADWIVDLDMPRFVEMTDAVSLNYRRVRGKWRQKWREFLWWTYVVDSVRLRRYERAIVERFEATFLVSQVDADYIQEGTRLTGPVIVAPNGVDIQAVPFLGPGEGFDIGLIGNFESFQNMDAAHFLVEEILPLVQARFPQARARLVGRMPAGPGAQLARHAGVDVTGQVDSMVEAVRGCAVGVAPVRLGAGVQNKVLEYLALGLPAVATSLAQEGIEAGPQELLVADGAADLAAAICRLLEDRELGLSMARHARTLIETHFSWRERLAPLVEAVRARVD